MAAAVLAVTTAATADRAPAGLAVPIPALALPAATPAGAPEALPVPTIVPPQTHAAVQSTPRVRAALTVELSAARPQVLTAQPASPPRLANLTRTRLIAAPPSAPTAV